MIRTQTKINQIKYSRFCYYLQVLKKESEVKSMRLSKIQKRIAALTLAAVMGIGISGTGAFAAVTRVSYNFSVAVGQKDTSENVQKTTSTSTNYAHATITAYGNTTNADHLRLRVLRSSTAVTGYAKVKATGSKNLSYTTTVSSGQSVKLRGYVAAAATYGYGVMSGTFEP